MLSRLSLPALKTLPTFGAFRPISGQRLPPNFVFSPISTSAVARFSTKQFNRLTARSPDWESREVSLKILIEDFRNIQSWERYCKRMTNPKFVECRNAERALYQLDLSRIDTPFTLKDIHGVLEESNSTGWSVIESRVFDNKSEIDLLKPKEKTIVELCRVHGVGPARVDKLYENGVRNIKDLLRECANPDSTAGVLHAQYLGAYYLKDIEQLIPRSETVQWQKILDAACKKVDPKLEGFVLGSYRRESPYSSDIDYVIKHPDITSETSEQISGEVLRKLVDVIDKHVLGELGKGKKQFQGIVHLRKGAVARRIDINVGASDHFGCKMLASTGDDRLQRIIRGRAKDMHLFLNDVAIGPRVEHHSGTASHFDKTKLMSTPEEEDVFGILGLPFLEPKQRNHSYYSKLPE